MERVRTLDAYHVIDHVAEDFTTRADRYQFIIDAVGKSTFSKCRHLLLPGGICISTELGPRMQNLLRRAPI